MTISFGELTTLSKGVGQVRFYAPEMALPLLSIGFCCDGFWELPAPLIAACAAQARTGNYSLSFGSAASPHDPLATVSIVYQTGKHISEYSDTARGKSPPGSTKLLCVVGNDPPSLLNDFDGVCTALDWNAALAPLRLIVPSHGLVGYDFADTISFLRNNITLCEIWRLDDPPTEAALGADALWLGFSNRLLVREFDAAARAIAERVSDRTHVTWHASLETTPTMQVDAMIGTLGHVE